MNDQRMLQRNAYKYNGLAMLLALAVMSCGGSLSDEQRAKLREAEKTQEIRRVTDAEIMTTAMEQGQRIASLLQEDSRWLDSLGSVYHSRIRWLAPGATNMKALESRLIEAIITGLQEGIVKDNVQAVGTDSLLYTKPIVKTFENGSIEYVGTWSIMISKKYLILSMD